MTADPPPLTAEQQADLALGRAVRLLHEEGKARVIVVTYDEYGPLVRGTGPARRVIAIHEKPSTIIPTA